MLILVNVLFFLNLKKIFKLNSFLTYVLFIISILLSVIGIVLLKGYSGNIIFGIFVLVTIITEFYLITNQLHKYAKYLFTGVGCLVVGFAFWLADVSKLYCFPYNLLNGRTIFHMFTALTIYFLYVYYEANEKS